MHKHHKTASSTRPISLKICVSVSNFGSFVISLVFLLADASSTKYVDLDACFLSFFTCKRTTYKDKSKKALDWPLQIVLFNVPTFT